MKRDFKIFPSDENGDVLWRMKEQGDNLSKAREIDFSVVFPSQAAALKFAVYLLRNGQKVSCSEYEGSDEMRWQVQAHPVMKPTHGNISEYEKRLADDATELGGQNDGWGSLQQD